MFFALFTYCERDDGDERFASCITGFLATDPSREQSFFCQGHCHLAKFSHRLTSFDIQSSGAKNLLDVLEHFPAVFLNKTIFGRPEVGINGFLGQSRILVLLDGVRLNNPFDQQALFNLPAQNIDYIDVYNGPNGTWFGEGSVLGVIDVRTKQLPETQFFTTYGSDQSISSGFSTIHKKRRIKSGLFASFSTLNLAENNSSQFDANHPFRGKSQQFSINSLWSSGFLDWRISNTAQAHVLVRSNLIHEQHDPTFALSPNPVRGNFHNTAWINDIHLLKKRAQKNVLDIFFSASYFRSEDRLSATEPMRFNTYDSLRENYSSLRFELGTNFHFKPWQGHNLFFGVGGITQGILNGTHTIRDNNTASSKSTAFNFDRSATIFGRPSLLFQASNGHVYSFIQDEWRIKSPLLVTIGSRMILPIESTKFSAELLPTVGAVITPISNLRIKIALHTSLRSPTLRERSDRLQEYFVLQPEEMFSPVELDYEKSHSIAASLWYGEQLGNSQVSSSLTAHMTRISNAIVFDDRFRLNNNHEIQIAGLRSMSEINFAGGHRFSLGLFYSLAYQKDFDSDGYPTCTPGFFYWPFSPPQCPLNESIPRILLRANLLLDALSVGNITLSCSFSGMSQLLDVFFEPHSEFEIVYRTKPLWRHMTAFWTTKGTIGGRSLAKKIPNSQRVGNLFKGALLTSIGLTIFL